MPVSDHLILSAFDGTEWWFQYLVIPAILIIGGIITILAGIHSLETGELVLRRKDRGFMVLYQMFTGRDKLSPGWVKCGAYNYIIGGSLMIVMGICVPICLAIFGTLQFLPGKSRYARAGAGRVNEVPAIASSQPQGMRSNDSDGEEVRPTVTSRNKSAVSPPKSPGVAFEHLWFGNDRIQQVNSIDRVDGVTFFEDAPPGGVLVGVNFRTLDDGAICGLQPVFQVAHEYAYGKWVGGDEGNQLIELAEPGYAVGRIEIRSPYRSMAFRLVFYRVDGARLDIGDSYQTEVIGKQYGKENFEPLGPEPQFIVGFGGEFAAAISGYNLEELTVKVVDDFTHALGGPTSLLPPTRSGLEFDKEIVSSKFELPPTEIDQTTDGRVLVGMRICMGAKWSGSINGVQPIYQAQDGYRAGKWLGTAHGEFFNCIAKPGFVVGNINYRASLAITALQLKFVSVKDGIINDTDCYWSDWIGGRGGSQQSATTQDSFIVGLAVYYKQELERFGWYRIHDPEAVTNEPTVSSSPFIEIPAIVSTENHSEVPPANDFRPPVSSEPTNLTSPEQALPRLEYESSSVTEVALGRFEKIPSGTDRAENNGVLVALRIAVGEKWGGSIYGVQPVYQSEDRYLFGEWLGTQSGETSELIAKPGYLIGNIEIRSGLAIAALRVKFVKLTNGRLDKKEHYYSDWIGGNGGSPKPPAEKDSPIAGIAVYHETDELLRFGFLAVKGRLKILKAVETRTWKSSDGKFSVEAKLVSSDGESVVLEKENGEVIEVSIERLGDDDKSFLRNDQ